MYQIPRSLSQSLIGPRHVTVSEEFGRTYSYAVSVFTCLLIFMKFTVSIFRNSHLHKFHLGIGLLGSIILYNLSGLQLFALSGFWEVKLG